MNTILTYKCSEHFNLQIKKRSIDPYLISICLAKGKTKKLKNGKIKFVLSLEQLITAAKQKLINPLDYKGLSSIEVITKGKILITAYKKFSDISIYNILNL